MKEKMLPIMLSAALSAGSPADAKTSSTGFDIPENVSSVVLSPETEAPAPRIENLKEMKKAVEEFSWEDFNDDEKLTAFKDQLVDGYMLLTESENATRQELIDNTIFFREYDDFHAKMEELLPEIPVTEDDIGFVVQDYDDSDKSNYLMNLENLKEKIDSNHAGYFLMDSLWYSWITEDVVPSDFKTKPLSNPKYGIVKNSKDPIGYYGGIIYTEDRELLTEFHFLLGHAISVRLITEKLNINIDTNKDYERIVNDFVPFEAIDIILQSYNSRISADKLYEYYSSSSLEEILKKFGANLEVPNRYSKRLKEKEVNTNLYKGLDYALWLNKSIQKSQS